MADKKITALTEMPVNGKDPAADFLHIIDYSASPVNKKITVANLFSNVNTDTHIYGNSKVFEVGQAAAANSHLRVAIGANASTDGAVTINDDGVDYVDFLVKSGESDQAISVDSGADTVTINGDGVGLDFIVNGENTNNMLRVDASADAVGIGIAAPATGYMLDIGEVGSGATGRSLQCAGGADIGGNSTITGSFSVTTTSTLTGNTTIGAVGAGVLIAPSVESIHATSATAVDCSVTHTTTLITTSDAGGNGALANGTVGQIKYITLITITDTNDDYVLTPATRNAFATITFDSVWDSVTLQYQTAGWTVIGTGGSVVIAA